MTPEGKLKADIKKMLQNHGVLVLKFQAVGVVGFPDLFCAYRGVSFFIELKTPGNVPRKIQAKRIKQLQDRGVLAAWFDNVADVEEWFLHDVTRRTLTDARQMRGPTIDRTGERYGLLTVALPRRRGDAWAWECYCDCGGYTVKVNQQLKDSTEEVPVSCGCAKGVPMNIKGPRKVFQVYRTDARSRGYDFDLSESQVASLISEECGYCGAPPSNTKYIKEGGRGSLVPSDTIEFNYNGIDRVDNSKGYSMDNCVTCCAECNISKRARTAEEFISHCRRVVEYPLK